MPNSKLGESNYGGTLAGQAAPNRAEPGLHSGSDAVAATAPSFSGSVAIEDPTHAKLVGSGWPAKTLVKVSIKGELNNDGTITENFRDLEDYLQPVTTDQGEFQVLAAGFNENMKLDEAAKHVTVPTWRATCSVATREMKLETPQG